MNKPAHNATATRPSRARRAKNEITVALYLDQINELWRRARAHQRPFSFELRDALDRGLGLDTPVPEPEQR